MISIKELGLYRFAGTALVSTCALLSGCHSDSRGTGGGTTGGGTTTGTTTGGTTTGGTTTGGATTGGTTTGGTTTGGSTTGGTTTGGGGTTTGGTTTGGTTTGGTTTGGTTTGGSTTGGTTTGGTAAGLVRLDITSPKSQMAAPSSDVTLAWQTANIRSGTCVASSSDATSTFTGTQADAGSKTVKSSATDGFYTYTLTCKDLSGNSVSDSKNLGVSKALAVTCPSSQVYSPFVLPDATVAKVDATGLCVGCQVTNETDVIDNNPFNYATMTQSVLALAGGNSITVTNTATHFPAGTEAGFVIQVPKANVLNLVLLGSTTVTLINDGGDTADVFPASTLLHLDLLGLLGNDQLGFLHGTSTVASFNGMRLNDGGLLSALPNLNVYSAGVCATPSGPVP